MTGGQKHTHHIVLPVMGKSVGLEHLLLLLSVFTPLVRS